MRPYYLSVNKYGYYLVSFTNKETGLRTNYKSTHTKDYAEAIATVMQWYSGGVPQHLSYYDLLKIIAKFCDVDSITKEIANFNRNMYLINRKDIADKLLKRMGESDINKWEM